MTSRTPHHLCLLALLPGIAFAQEAGSPASSGAPPAASTTSVSTSGSGAAPGGPTLPEVTVTTARGSIVPFKVPASVDRVDGSDLRDDRTQAQWSEGLAVVPGLQLQNRYNYAQDLQLSIRGFGARSTFGVRGVRIYVDGIPATLPDGQGQTSNIDVASLDRVEVLRGPFSALYGNSSGGVLQAFTAPGEGRPRLSYSAAAGSNGTWRQGLEVSGAEGIVDYRLGASRFRTDGWREQSSATRDLVNGRLGLNLENGDRLTFVYNRVRLEALDPLGLTAQQFASDPRGAPLAVQYNTRKSVEQNQAGVTWEHRLSATQQVRLMAYGGGRETVQYQSIPASAQTNPLHAGGVIDLERDYGGADLRWRGAFDLAGRPFELVAGIAYDTLRERPSRLSELDRHRGRTDPRRRRAPAPQRAQHHQQCRSLCPGGLAVRRAMVGRGGGAAQQRAFPLARRLRDGDERRRQRQRALQARPCPWPPCGGSPTRIWRSTPRSVAASKRRPSTSCPIGPMVRAA